MKTVKFTVVYVSPKNSKFAILAPIVTLQVGNKTIVTRGQGGFLESDSDWEMGESIDIPADKYQLTTRKTSTGSELPVIELLA